MNISVLTALPALVTAPGLFLLSFGIPVTTIPEMKLEPASPAPKSLVPQLSRTCSDEMWTRSDESWIRGQGGPIMRRHTDSGIQTGRGCDQGMLYVEKYRKSGKLGNYTATRPLLYVFEALHAGRAHVPAVFIMNRDEDMRAVLDDDDYAEWEAKRMEALGE